MGGADIKSVNEDTYEENSKYAFFDTGTSFNLVPQGDFRVIKLRVGQELNKDPDTFL